MTKTIALALAAFSFLALARRCASQDIVSVIYLSPSETATAKQTAEALLIAYDRDYQAKTAWQNFHRSYQAAHPDLPGLVMFASDFKIAFVVKDVRAPFGRGAAAIELSAEEREKAESLQREMVEAKRALDAVRKSWQDYQYELVSDHFPGGTSGVAFKRSDGKSVMIADPWVSGAVFTPDYRVAVPTTAHP